MNNGQLPAVLSQQAPREFQACTLIQVHDELVVEAPEEVAEDAMVLVVQMMEAAYSHVLTDVKIRVEAKVGSSWAEAKG